MPSSSGTDRSFRPATRRLALALAAVSAGAIIAYLTRPSSDHDRLRSRLRSDIGFEKRVQDGQHRRMQGERERQAALEREWQRRIQPEQTKPETKAAIPAAPPKPSPPPAPPKPMFAEASTRSGIISRGRSKIGVVRAGLLRPDQMSELEAIVLETQQKIDQTLEGVGPEVAPLSRSTLRNLLMVMPMEIILEAERRFLAQLPASQRETLVRGGFSLFDEISAVGKVEATLARLQKGAQTP